MTKIYNTEVFLEKSKFYKLLVNSLIVITVFMGAALFFRWHSSKPLDGLPFSREIYDRHGTLLRLSLSGDQKYRIWKPLERINPQYVEAVLLLEDQHFYLHPGINPWSLVKALRDYKKDGSSPGASTITMQLARLRYGLKTRTIRGKLWQIVKAIEFELKYSKHDILEAYLNLVPLGGPVEGVGAASRIFFSKPAEHLTLAEGLLLAVIPQSPNQRGLGTQSSNESQSLQEAKERLISRWIASHPQDKRHAIEVRLPLISQKIKELPFHAPHFTEMILQNSSETTVNSTLDLKIQKLIEEKTTRYIQSKRHIGIKNAAVIVVNHETQEVLGYLGSSDFFNEDIEGQVNGLLAKRSPGSTLKPFVYALAFQQGLIHPKTLLKDTPTSFALYDPENFDQKFMGPVSAEQALILSRNIPAVALSNQLNKPTLFEFLQKAGIYFPRPEEYYGLSVVLGGTEITPWEMAHLYGALANRGEWQDFHWEQNHPVKKTISLLSPESAFTTLDILTRAPRPHEHFRKDWVESYFPVAWKTGTSHGFRDAWTAGVVGPYTIVVWAGNFNNIANEALVGRDVAAPLFFQIIDGLPRKELENPAWASPVGLAVEKIQVCAVSGHLPHDFCHDKTETWFQPGVSPIAKCDIHRPVLVNLRTGLRTCDGITEASELRIFEFWPSDLKNLFEQAGIKRRLPPPFSKNCSLTDMENTGAAPRITSPMQNVTYLKSLSSDEKLNTLTFEAIADNDAAQLFWFINQTFIGKSQSSKSLTYHTHGPGDYVVTVIDDLGRSDSKKISIQAVQ
jgi:penicillin-binding protein 1C